FDGRGNYTIGLRDQLVFPEVDYSKVDKVKGMNVSIVTDARTDAEALALLRFLGMPFRAEAERRQEGERSGEKAGDERVGRTSLIADMGKKAKLSLRRRNPSVLW